MRRSVVVKEGVDGGWDIEGQVGVERWNTVYC